MPLLGLGTYRMAKDNFTRIIESAYQCGYRKIDTARYYQNESLIGDAIAELGIPRNELFITTKMDVEYLYWQCSTFGRKKRLPIRKESFRHAFFEQCERLKTNYVDLYLLHAPYIKYFKYFGSEAKKLYKEGYIKAFGVCLFSKREFEAYSEANDALPMVNQIEVSPFNTNKDILSFCKEHNIRVEAFATFGTTKKIPQASSELFENPIISDIAHKYGKHSSQIVLRWAIQQGVSVIPKSSNEKHQRENMDIFNFELSAEDMVRIDSLDEGIGNRYFR